jgi:hypothetical protein
MRTMGTSLISIKVTINGARIENSIKIRNRLNDILLSPMMAT